MRGVYKVVQPATALCLLLGLFIGSGAALSCARRFERAVPRQAALCRVLGVRRLLRAQKVSNEQA